MPVCRELFVCRLLSSNTQLRVAINFDKLERFAVLKNFRGTGVGQELVRAVLADLPEDANYVYLHAQVQAVSLYEKFNFEKTGPQFEEAGIQHFKMVLK